jgi:hypothetical protein
MKGISNVSKRQRDIREALLWSLTTVLLVACGVLLFLVLHKTPTNSQAASSPTSVNLGSMQYQFVSGKAVKRTDASVTSLRSFLDSEAVHSGCPLQQTAVEHVARYTADETQVFLKYGCGAADSPMYAVKVNGVWKAISPTGHFDELDLPGCVYVAQNGISKQIAPVCSNTIELSIPATASRYIVR